MQTPGKLLKETRLKQGLTVREASDGVCSQSLYYAYESDSRVPSCESVVGLSERLGLDLMEFINVVVAYKKYCRGE